MLSKCVNPSCHARFQYLQTGKLFVVRARRNTTPNGPSATQPSTIHEPRRYYWLCASCARLFTIQASGFGRARIAPVEILAGEAASVCVLNTKITDAEAGCPMEDANAKLDALRKELEFLESGGYRTGLGWLPPLIFEDSPICPKASYGACPDHRCVLMDFVPEDRRQEKIPCRHIALDQSGETLESLYNTANLSEIEDTLRAWLKSEIGELESQRKIPEQGAA